MTVTVVQLRTLVSDPKSESQIFDDSHYDVIIAIETNVYRAAATAAKTLAAHFAGKVSITVGPVKIENQQKFEHYDTLANSFDQRAREGGGSGAGEEAMAPGLSGVSNSEIDSNNEDSDRYAGAFSRGLDDNPSDSTQSYDG